MKLPSFLIIGAAKSGTTSLYEDLKYNERLFFPELKEVGSLRFDYVLEELGKISYSKYFKRAKSTQLCGEASTGYSKHPLFGDVPGRALEVLGEHTKIIYIVRNPLSRIISQHAHLYALGLAPYDINDAIRDDPSYVMQSRYFYQIDLWLQYFRKENVRIVQFEKYIVDRQSTADSLFHFLDVNTIALNKYQISKVANRSVGRRVPYKPIFNFINTQFYGRVLKPSIPKAIRRKLFLAFTKPGRTNTSILTNDNRNRLENELAEDRELFYKLLGIKGNPPNYEWDLWDDSVKKPIDAGS